MMVMNNAAIKCLTAICVVSILLGRSDGGELQTDVKLEVNRGEKPMTYDVLLPDGYDDSDQTYPLVLFLHGGGTNGYKLLRMSQEWIEELWDQNLLPPMVFVTPQVGPYSFYLDFKDGSKKWESLVTGPFLKEVRNNYRVSSEPERTLLAGVSMGGAGALQIGLKRPAQFRAIAAVEPAIQPALRWEDVDKKMFFWFTAEQWEERFGKPVSGEFWAANNPATIASRRANQIRESEVKVYLDCADEDYMQLHQGAEFLHRTMWDAGIKHEYHVFNGADHVGPTLKPRVQEALQFIGRSLVETKPDPDVIKFRKDMDFWRLNGHPPPKN